MITTIAGAKRLGGDPRGLAPWARRASTTGGGPRSRPRPRPVGTDPVGPLSLRPPSSGFALRWEDQRNGVLWISGDTVLYDRVREVADRLDARSPCCTWAGVRFPVTGPARYTMTATDAMELCQAIEPRTVIPIHYEDWKHFREGRSEIERELASSPADVHERSPWLE